MMLNIRCILLVIFLVNGSLVFAQRTPGKIQATKTDQTARPGKNKPKDLSRIELKWLGIRQENVSEEVQFTCLYFEGGSLDPEKNFLPVYHYTSPLAEDPGTASIKIINPEYAELNAEETTVLSALLKQHKESEIKIPHEIEVTSLVVYHRKDPFLSLQFIPIRSNENTGRYEKLISFNFSIQLNGKKEKLPPSRVYAANSVLASGEWFKIGITRDGIYKISYSFLQDLGLDLALLDPQNIRIYGNSGGMLPYSNAMPRPDDLMENAIYVSGENDGTFDHGDYILFYGQSPHRWYRSGNVFRHQVNIYSDTNYYFITADLGAGKRVNPKPVPSSFTTLVTSFNDYGFYEKDLFNPIRSGREWLGEAFNVVTDYDFAFSFPNLSNESPVTLRVNVAGRTTSGQNIFTIKANGQSIGSIATGAIGGSYTGPFAVPGENQNSFSTSTGNINLNISMSKGNSGAQGWLNFIEVNVRRNLVLSTDFLLFRDVNSIGPGNAKFTVQGCNNNTLVWDVTTPREAQQVQGTLTGNMYSFISSVDSLQEFVAFDKTAAFQTPIYVEKVTPQNLHALAATDLIIFSHPSFKQEAEELAEFHRNEDNLSVIVVTPSQIYNEFSSGKQDVTAIKDFIKMFYDRAGTNTSLMPKYLLLFGDASYDFKDRISGNTNYIPAYQSAESLSPTASYVSDDYFGLLDDNEGESTSDLVDIGVGRLVVKSSEEAQNAVNKIKHYYNRKTLGPWRNYNTFVGDDEDGNIHMDQANNIAAIVETNYKNYNIDKIFFDAYNQQVNSGGQRYPDVNSAIDHRIDLGTLMITYVGHGGELGWAHERVLEISQINKWSNFDNMPLFITATCEFSRFDDPQRSSAGEFVFLNPNGGGIALFSTTRLVYSQPNYEIVQAFTDTAFSEINNEMPRLGDILKATKLKGPKNINSRNFSLLGDPALRLAYPKYDIVATQVPDMKALSRVTIKGYVADENGKMTNFNGVVYPLVFDKTASINTLNNDNVYWDSANITVPKIYRFKSQKSILFKGKASVTNGEFEYTFVVPKDIVYSLGNGRVSHYGENGVTDASGYYDNFIIGGADSTAVADNTGPQIQLFLNDEKFVFGGITDENPKLFAKLFDENGINTAGNGIGHDIVALLDANTSGAIVLNDYYEAEINSYQRGTIRYPLKDLQEGKHTLTIKAFDVYNNSGDANTEFVVAKSAELALEHVLNYPNPFTTNTAFYFEHNQPGQNLDISIQVFTVSGKLVKTIDSFVYADTFRAGPIYWDGKDDFGDKIGKGVYVYKLKVLAPNGKVVNKFEKLVVLN